jgi:predicted transcriptional regulator
MSQLRLDFAKFNRISTHQKKMERLSFTCSEEFKEFLDLMVDRLGTDRSNLVYRYVLEGMQRDLAETFLPEPHLDKSLRDILKEGR